MSIDIAQLHRIIKQTKEIQEKTQGLDTVLVNINAIQEGVIEHKGEQFKPAIAETEDEVNVLTEGEVLNENVNAIVADEESIYVAHTKVEKFNQDTLDFEVSSLEYGGNIFAIVELGDHIYIGGQTTHTIWKLNKQTLDLVAQSSNLGAIFSLAIDEDHIYAGTTSGTVSKLDIITLSVQETSVFMNVPLCLGVDDAFVYAGARDSSTDDAVIIKMYKSDLEIDTLSPAHTGLIRALVLDENNIYYGGENTGLVIKANKDNLNTLSTSAAYGGTIRTLAERGDYVYVGGQDENRVRRLDKASFSFDLTIDTFFLANEYVGAIRTMSINGDYLFYSGDTPGTPIRWENYKLFELLGYKKI